VPLGYSRKFWYDDNLSAEVSSTTSPSLGLKRVYLDPNLLPLVQGKRVVVIDDAVSSGRTLKEVWDLLEDVGAIVEGVGVVMKQGSIWKSALGEGRAGRVVGVFESPLLRAVEGGWVVR
jgi:adenine/guanine phosphoribosyltransferase-like PRPP-binding protein